MMEISSSKAVSQVSGSAMVSPKLPERPELGLTSEGPCVSVRSNLSGNYRMSEAFRKTPGGTMKLYSVTAL